MHWLRKAAENGLIRACLRLATDMYMDQNHAREIGHAGAVAALAIFMEGHNVPPV
jgi:TPR repeat protein